MTDPETILETIEILLSTGRPTGIPAPSRERRKALVVGGPNANVPDITFYATQDVPAIPSEKAEPEPMPVAMLGAGDVQHRRLNVAFECTAAPGATTTAFREANVLRRWVLKAICGHDWRPNALGAREIVTEFDYMTLDVQACQHLVTIQVGYLETVGTYPTS